MTCGASPGTCGNTMRRPSRGPLAGGSGHSRAARLENWGNVRDPRDPFSFQEGADLGRELRRRVLAYGLEHCLTAAQRQAVELCYGEGMSLTVAAQCLGVCPSTVSRRLAAAMEKLRKMVGPPVAAR